MQKYIIACRFDKINSKFFFFCKLRIGSGFARKNIPEVSFLEIRTDLAMEERELRQQSAEAQTKLPGVWARESQRKGVKTTIIKILDERGAQALRKPVGTYLTLELDSFTRREPYSFSRAAQALARELRRLAGDAKEILVVGLGNRAVTPDAVGPETLDSLIVTRHVKNQLPDAFGAFRSVSASAPGVLGTTGMESAELVRGAAERIKPDLIFVIDALAASNPSRICNTVQLSDTGIIPGSGIGNSRAAMNEETLGSPVVSIGVPTVVDAGSFLCGRGASGTGCPPGMIVTPRDIDARVREISRLIGYGMNLALHDGLTIEEIPCFLA